jgi:hypothetical protein
MVIAPDWTRNRERLRWRGRQEFTDRPSNRKLGRKLATGISGNCYQQKLALSSPTCGGSSVGVVGLRIKAMEFCLGGLRPWSFV